MQKHPGDAKPVLTENQDNLRRVDMRMNGLRVNNPGSSELDRLKAVREDIIGRMPKDEIVAYDKLMNRTKTKEELEAEAEAERIAMDANKDKPPI